MSSCSQLWNPATQRLIGFSSANAVITPMTPFAPTVGATYLQGVLLSKAQQAGTLTAGGTSSLTSTLVCQTAELRPDAPDDWAIVGSAPVLLSVTGNGEGRCDPFDMTQLFTGKMLARFGVATTTSGPSGPASADISLALALRSCGEMVSAWHGNVQATSTTNHYLSISNWLSAVQLSAVRAGIMVTSGLGNIQVKLAYRTAVSMKDVPSAWTPIGSFVTDASTAPVQSSLSLNSFMYVQFGIGYSVSSGTAGSGMVSVAAGIVRA
jgi:hypothetical protein